MIEQPPLGSIVNDLLNPSFEAVGLPVEVYRNLAPNPSFELDSQIPVGATRTDDWAANGAWSIHTPVTAEHVGGGVWKTSVLMTHLGDGVYETNPLIQVTHIGSGRYEIEDA